jgi:hypothetical protein
MSLNGLDDTEVGSEGKYTTMKCRSRNGTMVGGQEEVLCFRDYFTSCANNRLAGSVGMALNALPASSSC